MAMNLPVDVRALYDAGKKLKEDRERPVISGDSSKNLTTDCAGSTLTVSASSLGITATDNCDATVAITVMGLGKQP